MIRILFVCHGNICRSPMAEYVFNDMARKRGLAERFHADSAATSREEIGNGIYPPAARKLRAEGVPMYPHAARQITHADYERYDYLIGMDAANRRNMRLAFNMDPKGKVFNLLEFTGSTADIADPWYTDDFDATYRDVTRGCEALIGYLLRGK